MGSSEYLLVFSTMASKSKPEEPEHYISWGHSIFCCVMQGPKSEVQEKLCCLSWCHALSMTSRTDMAANQRLSMVSDITHRPPKKMCRSEHDVRHHTQPVIGCHVPMWCHAQTESQSITSRKAAHFAWTSLFGPCMTQQNMVCPPLMWCSDPSGLYIGAMEENTKSILRRPHWIVIYLRPVAAPRNLVEEGEGVGFMVNCGMDCCVTTQMTYFRITINIWGGGAPLEQPLMDVSLSDISIPVAKSGQSLCFLHTN